MKKLKTFLLTVLILLAPLPSSAFAESLEKLPTIQSTQQWKVVINKPDAKDAKLNQSKPGVYNVYSLDIQPIGDKDVHLVRVETYRPQPNSRTAYELFTFEGDKNVQPSFHHQNFPVDIHATNIIVMITWTYKTNDIQPQRKFKENFVFQQ
jgi:hypothetical protein